MNIAWFRKVLYSQPAWLPDGRQAKFESVGDDEGVAAVMNPEVAALYRTLADKKVGGVIEIDQKEYEELKKKPVIEPRKPPAPFQPLPQQLPKVPPIPDPALVPGRAAAGELPPPPKPPEAAQPKLRRPPPRKSASP